MARIAAGLCPSAVSRSGKSGLRSSPRERGADRNGSDLPQSRERSEPGAGRLVGDLFADRGGHGRYYQPWAISGTVSHGCIRLERSQQPRRLSTRRPDQDQRTGCRWSGRTAPGSGQARPLRGASERARCSASPLLDEAERQSIVVHHRVSPPLGSPHSCKAPSD
jgi:hypothetical protein